MNPASGASMRGLGLEPLFQAKRSLGQNFLVDPNTIRAIVACLGLEPGQRVFEIGPGRGALTRELTSLQARVTALEKDPYLARYLARTISGLDLIVGDALEFPWEGLQGDWKLIGNLPYNVAAPIIWEVVSRTRCKQVMVFTVQKEVGQRMAAGPGQREYGALSVWVQSFARVCYERSLGRQVFRPRPKVESAVISIRPRSLPLAEAAGLNRLLRRCFQQRRKQLGKILRADWGPELEAWLAAWGLDRRARPEELSPTAFGELVRLLESGPQGKKA